MHEYQKVCTGVFASHVSLNNERTETVVLPGKEVHIAQIKGELSRIEEG
jgi:hypothetical protein